MKITYQHILFTLFIEYLSAFENQDLEKVAQKKQEIQEIFSKQTQVIQDINNYCSQNN